MNPVIRVGGGYRRLSWKVTYKEASHLQAFLINFRQQQQHNTFVCLVHIYIHTDIDRKQRGKILFCLYLVKPGAERVASLTRKLKVIHYVERKTNYRFSLSLSILLQPPRHSMCPRAIALRSALQHSFFMFQVQFCNSPYSVPYYYSYVGAENLLVYEDSIQ